MPEAAPPARRRASPRCAAHPLGAIVRWPLSVSFFFFNDTATTEIYTLSLHDALPISPKEIDQRVEIDFERCAARPNGRSEEHTSELQSRLHLACRLLLAKNNKTA